MGAHKHIYEQGALAPGNVVVFCIDVWYEFVREMTYNDESAEWKMPLVDLLDHSHLFPTISKALCIAFRACERSVSGKKAAPRSNLFL